MSEVELANPLDGDVRAACARTRSDARGLVEIDDRVEVPQLELDEGDEEPC